MEEEIISLMTIWELETKLKYEYRNASPLIKWKIWYFIKRLIRRAKDVNKIKEWRNN